MPLHRATGSIALLLAGVSAIAAIHGFVFSETHDGSETSDQISGIAGSYTTFVLLWAGGGLLLTQQVGYSRLLVTVLAAASISLNLEGIDTLTAGSSEAGAWIARIGLALAGLVLVLLLASAVTTWTRPSRAVQQRGGR
ncbi:hypothetical protein [Nocardia asteroides]|uniref:hypothetical protein n=1 Tax=Nocardia asteroides TaxID=1824 RepID=UPI00341F6E91